jgi:hypothetical protein
MSDNIKLRIVAMREEFLREYRKLPTEIWLTRVEECELEALTSDDVGELSGKMIAVGPRKAIEQAGGTVLGMRVVWDAQVFEVK